MRPLITALAIGLLGVGAITTAYAAAPTFTVKCMHTAGPKVLPKYGVYYFFLNEGQVKGYGCSIPGRPCQIVSRNDTTIVFQTPGDDPDTLSIDLRTGAIQHTTSTGEQATFACRQVPNNS